MTFILTPAERERIEVVDQRMRSLALRTLMKDEYVKIVALVNLFDRFMLVAASKVDDAVVAAVDVKSQDDLNWLNLYAAETKEDKTVWGFRPSKSQMVRDVCQTAYDNHRSESDVADKQD